MRRNARGQGDHWGREGGVHGNGWPLNTAIPVASASTVIKKRVSLEATRLGADVPTPTAFLARFGVGATPEVEVEAQGVAVCVDFVLAFKSARAVAFSAFLSFILVLAFAPPFVVRSRLEQLCAEHVILGLELLGLALGL